MLEWITREGNYLRFRGKGNNGTTKKQFAQQIADHLNNSGVKVHRDAKQVLNKIKHIEDLF